MSGRPRRLCGSAPILVSCVEVHVVCGEPFGGLSMRNCIPGVVAMVFMMSLCAWGCSSSGGLNADGTTDSATSTDEASGDDGGGVTDNGTTDAIDTTDMGSDGTVTGADVTDIGTDMSEGSDAGDDADSADSDMSDAVDQVTDMSDALDVADSGDGPVDGVDASDGSTGGLDGVDAMDGASTADDVTDAGDDAGDTGDDSSSCVPACGPGVQCGDDGCGGECGTCEAGETCTAGICSTPGACTNAQDEDVFATTDVAAEIGDCAPGCTFAGDKAACGAECMVQIGMTQGCAECFGGTVACVFENCTLACIAGATQGCLDCQEDNGCFTEFEECAGIPPLL